MDTQQELKRKIPKRRRKKGAKTTGKRQKATDLKDFCNDDAPSLLFDVDGPKELVLLEPPPCKPLPLLLFQRELGFSGIRNPRRHIKGFKGKDLQPRRIIQSQVKKGLVAPRKVEDRFPQLQRDLGYSRHWNVLQWQSQMMIHSLEEDYQPVKVSNCKPRKGWRPYIQRSIPFTKLQTPGDAAVLAIDRHGSYSVALNVPDSNSRSVNAAGLCLSLYGLPCPSVLEPSPSAFSVEGEEKTERKQRKRDVSPLLQTVTLLSRNASTSGAFLRTVMDPATILVSSDWAFGVAFLVDPNSSDAGRAMRIDEVTGGVMRWKGTDPFDASYEWGSIVLFSLPRHGRGTAVQTFRAPRIKMVSLHSSTMRSLLWKVQQVPLKGKRDQQSTFLFDAFYHRHGHLLFQDEGNGFRLTWITNSSWRDEDACIEPVQASSSVKSIPTRNIISKVEDSAWTETFNDRQTGQSIHMTNNQERHLIIAFEVFLDVSLLLGELLLSHSSMTKHLSKDKENPYPPHKCNVISVNDGGRTVDLLIVFASQSTGYAVYVTVDLFTQQFRANHWIRNNNVGTLSDLCSVCHFFAIHDRMKQRKLGPYAVDPDDAWVWNSLCREKPSQIGYEFEMERDLDGVQWKPFADTAKATREKGDTFNVREANPKRIPYSSLYPDCELITNRNLRTETPVSELTGMKSPLKLVYR